MARTSSKMLALGTKAPDFKLLDTVSGEYKSLSGLKSEQATVVIFMCNHCPYVILMKEKLAELARAYHSKGVRFIAISSNDAENYPDDSPENMKLDAEKYGYCFPYLYDETQVVAKAYDAACTPDLYVFDSALRLVYRGQFDESRPGVGIAPTGADLSAALDAILAGDIVSTDQTPSLGCNIKWITQVA